MIVSVGLLMGSTPDGDRFHVLGDDGLDAQLTAEQIGQAVRVADQHYAGLIESSGQGLNVPGRYVLAPGGPWLADAVVWLSKRGLLTFVNADPGCVDLAPEVRS